MYPILFEIGGIQFQSYYVMWSVALCVAMFWSNKRIEKSGLPLVESASVVTWSFAAMLLGARAFEYIWNWRVYYENPSLFLDLERGGLAEIGAVISAIATAFFVCRAKKISFWQFSDTVSPAVLLTMAIGRWGCYLNGCCGGTTAHPVQLYYSSTAAMILALVLALENYFKRGGIIFRYGIISPIGLGIYSASRLVIDPLRLDYGTPGMTATQIALICCVALSATWIAWSAQNIKKF